MGHKVKLISDAMPPLKLYPCPPFSEEIFGLKNWKIDVSTDAQSIMTE